MRCMVIVAWTDANPHILHIGHCRSTGLLICRSGPVRTSSVQFRAVSESSKIFELGADSLRRWVHQRKGRPPSRPTIEAAIVITVTVIHNLRPELIATKRRKGG